MLAMAVSPPQRYSTESTAAGSSQPVPVAAATTRTWRSKAPVRSSSTHRQLGAFVPWLRCPGRRRRESGRGQVHLSPA